MELEDYLLLTHFGAGGDIFIANNALFLVATQRLSLGAEAWALHLGCGGMGSSLHLSGALGVSDGA